MEGGLPALSWVDMKRSDSLSRGLKNEEFSDDEVMTVAGTVCDFHAIPFYPVDAQAPVEKEQSRNLVNYKEKNRVFQSALQRV